MQGETNINRIHIVAILIFLLICLRLFLVSFDLYEFIVCLKDPTFKSKTLIWLYNYIYGVIHSVFFLIGIFISKIIMLILHSMGLRSCDLESSYLEDGETLSSEIRTEHKLTVSLGSKMFNQSIIPTIVENEE